ncbi:4'-phosphopantetheinyl transferase sfp [Pandoraea captiosa]|uniref:4'-phosphopantetheinyl transferase sfp n=1 Tax=Pandoraea captiosa TaxID=2508302 RepID=A0A5E4ZHJ1_9BURK|nr:4'-phosphopantetheinyl transferase superfamily protein [Pandoraea captiosa]VVE60396.1 4'-phosphopantetheinyl transferase sfp [Pandoraea captiosa]
MQFVSVADGFRNPARVLARLSPDEHFRMARFHREADRARFAVMRASLREALGKVLAVPPGDVAFETDANGRPHLAGGGPPDFNVSHAGQWGLLAHSPDVRVGVDIERLDAVGDPRSLWGVCLHPEEQRALLMLSLRLAGQGGGAPAIFHWVWALKEAALKALGSGVQDHLTALSLDVDAVSLAARAVNGKFHDMFSAAPVGQPIAWRSDEPGLARALRAMELRLLPAPPGYAAALAWLPGG